MNCTIPTRDLTCRPSWQVMVLAAADWLLRFLERRP